MAVNVIFLIVFMTVNLLRSTQNNQDTSALKASNRTVHVRFVNNPFEFTSTVPYSRETSKNFARQKRSLIELYNMVSCATGCNPLAYKGYGCYCGFLGSGEPVDEIDRCCAEHDDCYTRSNCIFPFHYAALYNWECSNGNPYCVNWIQKGYCSTDLCECDKRLAECLKKNFLSK